MGYFRFTDERLSWKSPQRSIASAASCSFCVAGIFSVFLSSAIQSQQCTNSFCRSEHLGGLPALADSGPRKMTCILPIPFLELECMSAFTLQTADSRYKCLIPN